MTTVARPASRQANTYPQTPASERSVYYDASSNESAHDVHANPNSSSDTITREKGKAAASDNTSAAAGGADVQRKPSVAAGALEGEQHLQPREPASGGILAKSAKAEEKQPQSSVRDSGFASMKDEKSVAFAPTMPDDQPSPAYEAAHGPMNPPVEKKMASDARIDEDKPLTDGKASVQRTSTGAFAKGAAVTGPDAQPAVVEGQHERAATAESQLTEKQKAKLTKQELKDAKKMIKMIKSEGAAQEKSVKKFMAELSKLQKVQKAAAADESKALTAHGKATKIAHKMHAKFLEAKARDEQAAADEKAKREQLESNRSYAAEMTDKLARETKAYEELNEQLLVDKRERAVKMDQLSQMKHRK